MLDFIKNKIQQALLARVKTYGAAKIKSIWRRIVLTALYARILALVSVCLVAAYFLMPLAITYVPPYILSVAFLYVLSPILFLRTLEAIDQASYKAYSPEFNARVDSAELLHATVIKEMVIKSKDIYGSDDILMAQCEAIATSGRIECLVFDGDFDSGKHVDSLWKALQKHQNIRHLKFINFNSCAAFNKLIVDLLINNKSLESFEMVNAFFEAILPLLIGLRTLQRLQFTNIEIDLNFTQKLQQVLANNQSLYSLTLNSCRFTDTAAASLANIFRRDRLKKIGLSGSNMVLSTVNAIITLLQTSRVITSLSLGNNISESGMLSLVSAFGKSKSLKELDLSNNEVTEAVATSLAQILKEYTTLESITLRNCNLTAKEAMILARVFNSTRLKKIILAYNPMYRRNQQSEERAQHNAAIDVAKILKRNKTIESLDLAVGLSNTDKIAILEMLIMHKSLKELILNDDRNSMWFDDEDEPMKIAKLLEKHKSQTKLQSLSIGTAIGYPGFPLFTSNPILRAAEAINAARTQNKDFIGWSYLALRICGFQNVEEARHKTSKEAKPIFKKGDREIPYLPREMLLLVRDFLPVSTSLRII